MSADQIPDQGVRMIDGKPFCGKCGDRMVAGWQEDPFCPTCQFPRIVATAPPGETERQEVARLRAENERLAGEVERLHTRVLNLEKAVVDVAATDDFYGPGGRKAKAERALASDDDKETT